MKVYIGHDPREQAAVDVAVFTLKKVSGIEAELLCADRLRDAGLMTRLTDRRGSQYHDLISGAPMSTDFAINRFLTPIICQSSWALFVDADMVFVRDPREMLKEIVPGKAVYVVKHEHEPTALWKMVNQQQTVYPRKNWSSVMLFDTEHPANRRLSLWDVNNRAGRDLHRFCWLADDEIGDLNPNWNWPVHQQPRPDHLGIAHMTLGGPCLPGWTGGSFDAEWKAAHDELKGIT